MTIHEVMRSVDRQMPSVGKPKNIYRRGLFYSDFVHFFKKAFKFCHEFKPYG